MERKQDYTPEFRAETVKLVLAQGLSLAEAAKRLSVPKGTLGNWVANAKASTGPAAPGARTVTEVEAEVKQLRKELAETRMERDILKNFPRAALRPAPVGTETPGAYTEVVLRSSGRPLFGGLTPLKNMAQGLWRICVW